MRTEEIKDHQIAGFPQKAAHLSGQLAFLQNFIICAGLRKYNTSNIDVCDSFKKRKQVEIIKTGWPHGITIQISYIEQCRRWIISDGRESRLADEQEYIDSKGSKGERKLD
jgi:hypothetical protein